MAVKKLHAPDLEAESHLDSIEGDIELSLHLQQPAPKQACPKKVVAKLKTECFRLSKVSAERVFGAVSRSVPCQACPPPAWQVSQQIFQPISACRFRRGHTWNPSMPHQCPCLGSHWSQNPGYQLRFPQLVRPLSQMCCTELVCLRAARLLIPGKAWSSSTPTVSTRPEDLIILL